MTAAEAVDVDGLPPTQYLIVEVLAARWRTGEATWPFPTRLRPQLCELSNAGLITWEYAREPGMVRARFTDAGRAAALTATYEAPGWKTQREALARDLDAQAQWLNEQAAKGSDAERRDYRLRAVSWDDAARLVRGDR